MAYSTYTMIGTIVSLASAAGFGLTAFLAKFANFYNGVLYAIPAKTKGYLGTPAIAACTIAFIICIIVFFVGIVWSHRPDLSVIRRSAFQAV